MALTGLQKLANALEAFNPEKEIEKIVRANTGKIEDLERKQLAAGKNSMGKDFTFRNKSSYSLPTRIYKERYGKGIGAITSHFTLYGKGDLYNQLKVFIKGYTFDIKSAVSYFETVKIAVGEETFKLSEESRKEFYKEVLFPQFKKAFEKETGVKLTMR